MGVLITGIADFIGLHVAKIFMARGDEVFRIDNLNEYNVVDLNIADHPGMAAHSKVRDRSGRSNLVAQTGIRNSPEDPTPT